MRTTILIVVLSSFAAGAVVAQSEGTDVARGAALLLALSNWRRSWKAVSSS